jgi:hypothetical protein
MRHPSGIVTFIFTNIEGSTNCSASGRGIVEWSFSLASRRYNKDVSGRSAIISQLGRTSVAVPVIICLVRSFPQGG